MAYMAWTRGKSVALAKLLRKKEKSPEWRVCSYNVGNMAPSTHVPQRWALLPWVTIRSDNYLLWVALHEPGWTLSFVKFLDILFQSVLLQAKLYEVPKLCWLFNSNSRNEGGTGKKALSCASVGAPREGSPRERTRIWVSWPIKSPGFFPGVYIIPCGLVM